jgi:diguanylate cyclase (GGDEF)-like protein/PAS domain S-box-containing protein
MANERADALVRELAEALPVGVFLEMKYGCCYANRAAEHISGYTREELRQKRFCDLVARDLRELFDEWTEDSLSEGDPALHETKIITKNNQTRWISVTANQFRINGEPATLTAAYKIIDRRFRLPDQRDDSGLTNALRLGDVFDAEVFRTNRTGRPFAVLALRLDTLSITERYGYLMKKESLRRFIHILRYNCRPVDVPARMGAKDFAYVLPETNAEGAIELGRRIASRLRQGNEDCPEIHCDYGSSAYPKDGQTLDDLLEIACRRLDAVQS